MAQADSPVIRSDLPCSDCGYDLRTLSADGRCPECGQPIAQTLLLTLERSGLIVARARLPRSIYASLRDGLLLLLCAGACALAVALLPNEMFLYKSGPRKLVLGLVWGSWVLSLYGIWEIAAPIPVNVLRTSDPVARRILRAVVCFLTFAPGLAAPLFDYKHPMAVESDTASQTFVVAMVISLLLYAPLLLLRLSRVCRALGAN